jgi:hypothetical protein
VKDWNMTKASGKNLGPAVKGKGDGKGGLTDLQDRTVGENMALSNRDKAAHSKDRGQDRKWVETEQLQDHAANRGRG